MTGIEGVHTGLIQSEEGLRVEAWRGLDNFISPSSCTHCMICLRTLLPPVDGIYLLFPVSKTNVVIDEK